MFLLVRNLILGCALALLAPLVFSQQVDPELQPGNPHFNPFKFADELIQRREIQNGQIELNKRQISKDRFYSLPSKTQKAIEYGFCIDSLLNHLRTTNLKGRNLLKPAFALGSLELLYSYYSGLNTEGASRVEINRFLTEEEFVYGPEVYPPPGVDCNALLNMSPQALKGLSISEQDLNKKAESVYKDLLLMRKEQRLKGIYK